MLEEITDRKNAENAPVLIWKSDVDKLCTYFNEHWFEFTGESLESQLGNGWANGVHPEDLERCLRIYTEAFDRREHFRMEYRLRRHDGEYRWLLDIGVPKFNQHRSFVGYTGSCIDVTERKRSEEALLSLTRRLIAEQEQERERIARELHDNIGERVSLLTLNLAELQESPLRLFEVQDRIGELEKEASEIATDIQALSHQFHSAELKYCGIAVAVRGFCHEFGKQTTVRIDFQSQDLPSPVSDDISLCLFRVLQEALRNAVKHNGARHVEVELWGTPDEIHLVVSFESGDAKLDLTSMEERLKLHKGTLSIESQHNRGTKIHARVPLGSRSNGMRRFPA